MSENDDEKGGIECNPGQINVTMLQRFPKSFDQTKSFEAHPSKTAIEIVERLSCNELALDCFAAFEALLPVPELELLFPVEMVDGILPSIKPAPQAWATDLRVALDDEFVLEPE